MAITTKLAKKVLSRAEQKHLTQIANVRSMAAFVRSRAMQIKMKNEHPEHAEPCFDCRTIAIKLGIE